MSLRKLIFAAWAMAALLLSPCALADEATAEDSATATNKPTFTAKLQGGEMVGTHQVQRAFLSDGTNQIAFIVPADFGMDASKPQRIVLTQKDMRCFMTVNIRKTANGEQETDFYKSEALGRYPGAHIIQESSELVANHSGHAFDLEWVNSGGVTQSARVSFIPTTAGILEFDVLARKTDFKDARNFFNVLLSSVQTNERGKIVIIPLPDFS